MVKHFKSIHLPKLSIRDISSCYVPHIKSEESENVCHNVAALYEFATGGEDSSTIYERKNINIAIRILEVLRNYTGRENIKQIWKYISGKEYVNGFGES